MADAPQVHRLNICIEVPAMPGSDQETYPSFDDVLRYVAGLVHVKKYENGRIANAIFMMSVERNVETELEEKVPVPGKRHESHLE